METYYLIDFENVHNDGIANIECITKTDHVHIFSTQNATNIRPDIFWLNGDIKPHLVPARKQSLDMHLVSYLGHLLGINGKECSYVIISKDKDYDNIIKFWKEKGYPNISRKEKLPGPITNKKKTVQTATQSQSITQTLNSKSSAGVQSKMKIEKKELKVRSFFGKHFKAKLYVEHKDEIIQIILDTKTKQQVASRLNKIYSDEKVVSDIYNTVLPLINDLPVN